MDNNIKNKVEDGYYWVLSFNGKVWQIARAVNNTFFLIADPEVYHWENFSQIGQEIPSNFTLENSVSNG